MVQTIGIYIMSGLTVHVVLSGTQRDTFEQVMKQSKLTVPVVGGKAALTAENVLEVRKAVVAFFTAKFKRKTKDAELLRTCFDCERIVDKIDDRLYIFGINAPTENEDGDAQAIVDLEEVVDVEVKPDLSDKEKVITLIGKRAKHGEADDE
jgi:GTP:adenosylcobinamide-phosphate guanylyltransferase